MKFKVQSIHFTADSKLLEFVQARIDKLTHQHQDVIDGEVFLRLDKSDDSANKIAEIKLNVPGKQLFAKEQCKSFEEATDSVVEALSRQIEKHKEKIKIY